MWEKTEEQAYKKKTEPRWKGNSWILLSKRRGRKEEAEEGKRPRERRRRRKKKEVGKNFLNNNVHRCYSSRKNEKRKTIASTRKFSY